MVVITVEKLVLDVDSFVVVVLTDNLVVNEVVVAIEFPVTIVVLDVDVERSEVDVVAIDVLVLDVKVSSSTVIRTDSERLDFEHELVLAFKLNVPFAE